MQSSRWPDIVYVRPAFGLVPLNALVLTEPSNSRMVGKPEVIRLHPSRGLPATNLPVFPRRLQLSVPLGVNLLLMPGKHVLRRDVSDGAVQTHVIAMLHVSSHQTPRNFE
jgi:hypothetical protein